MRRHDEESALRDGMSPIVPFMLRLVDAVIRQRPTDLPLLRDSMELLFAFLSSPEGRTDVNVRYVDTFLMRGIMDDSYWAHLPQPFQKILWDAGAQLHDTFGAPEVATNFDSTPEQLRDRTQWLGADYPAT